MYKLYNNLAKDLKCLSYTDLSYRLWEAFLHYSGMQKRLFKPYWISDSEVFNEFGNRFRNKRELANHFRGRNNVKFFFPPDQRKQYSEHLNNLFSGDLQLLYQKAEAVLDHRFDLMGCQFVFNAKIDWHYAGENVRWPLMHWSSINVDGNQGLQDVRPLWELNRHQHFLTLGRAYWWTGDRKYPREFVSQLRSWIKENPAEMGINWQSNLEIAIRSISWIWAFHFFLHADEFDDNTLMKIVKVFIHSARHLERHLPYSRYCMRNNHIIGDAAGLALIAQTFPELNRSFIWKKKSFKVLYNELPRQVYPDGVNWEQSVIYHRFVLYLYFMVFRMEQLNGSNVSPQVWITLEKMFEFLFWVSRPDGSAPMIGDSDDGRAVVLGNEPVNDLRPTISTGALLFDRGDFKYAAGDLSEETFWLMGIGAFEQWKSLKGKNTDQIFRSFPAGGYYIARSGWQDSDSYLLYKNGPHSTFHAHSDQLHIELFSNGKEWLADPGTYVYNGNLSWRTFFRGTKAHNTVMVDGQHQSVPHRAFRWLNSARPLDTDAVAGRKVQWLWGGHTGYRRLRDPVIHHRGLINVMGMYTVVIDSYSALDRHQYESFFHFPPGKAEFKGDICRYSCPENDKDVCIMLPDRRLSCDIEKGLDEKEIQGWVSYRYGEKLPAPVLRCFGSITGDWQTASVLWPAVSGAKGLQMPKCSFTEKDKSVQMVIQTNDFTDYIFMAGNKSEAVNIKEIKSDSNLLFYRINAEGQPLYIFSVDGANLSIDNLLTIKGKWRYIELDIGMGTAWINGEMVDVRLTSGVINELTADKCLKVQQVNNQGHSGKNQDHAAWKVTSYE